MSQQKELKAAQALYEKQAEQSRWTVPWSHLCPVGKKLRVEQVRAVMQVMETK